MLKHPDNIDFPVYVEGKENKKGFFLFSFQNATFGCY